MKSLSQNIIEHAKRLYPKALSYKGNLTDVQFYEIEKQCDIDFYKLASQDIRYTIRYKAESEKQMNKELLMLYGARNAVLQMIDKGSSSFAKRLDDGTWQTVDWAGICNYLTDMIDKYKAESEDKE